MATTLPITGDRYHRHLLSTLEETEAVVFINDNLSKTIQQLDEIEQRLSLNEKATAVATTTRGETLGQTTIRTTLVQKSLNAGAKIYLLNPDTNRRSVYILAEDAVAGHRSIALTTGLKHVLPANSPIYCVEADPLELANRIELLESSMQAAEGATQDVFSGKLIDLNRRLLATESLLNNRVAQLETYIQQTASEIRLTAKKVVEDEVAGRLDQFDSWISITADEIELAVDRITNTEQLVERAISSINITADDIKLTAEKVKILEDGLSDAKASLLINAEGIKAQVVHLEKWSENLRVQRSEVLQLSSKIVQQVSWEDFEALEGSQVFGSLAAAASAGQTQLTLSDVASRLRTGDVLLVRDNDPTLQPWQRTWFSVAVANGPDEIPSSSTSTVIPTGVIPTGKQAASGSPVYLRTSLFTTIKTQTAFEISQAVIASQRVEEISTTSSALTAGSNYTSIPIQTGCLKELNHGDALVIYDEDDNLAWNVVIDLPGGELDNPYVPDTNGHVIPVQSFDPINDMPSGTPVFTATSALQSIIQQFADSITLAVSSANPFFVCSIDDQSPVVIDGATAGSGYDGTSVTEVQCSPTNRPLFHGDTLIVIHADGGRTALVVDKETGGGVSTGSTEIPVEPVELTASSGDGIATGILTELNIGLEGISVEGQAIYSPSWIAGGGTFGTAGNYGEILTHSNAGWALTRDGQFEAHDVYIRSTLQSSDWVGALNAEETALAKEDGVPTNIGASGWVLTKEGELVAHDIYLRGEVSIEAANGSVKLDGSGIELPEGISDGGAGTPWIDWVGADGRTGYIGAWFNQQETMTLALASKGAILNDIFLQASNKVIVSNTLQVNGNLSLGNNTIISPATAGQDILFTTTQGDGVTEGASGNIDFAPGGLGRVVLEGVAWPNGAAADADYMLRTTATDNLEWRDMTLERVYDFAIYCPGAAVDGETLASAGSRNYIMTGISVGAGNWGSPSATVVVNGQSFTSGSNSWSGSSTESGASVTVSGPANGLSDVSVSITGYWIP